MTKEKRKRMDSTLNENYHKLSYFLRRLLRIYLPYTPWNIKTHKEIKRFYSQFIKKGDICFDIGSNIGNYTDYFLKLGAKVISVEPQINCLKKLQQKFAYNKDVTILGKAVGKNEGTGYILICEKANSLSTMSDKWKEKGRYASNYIWNQSQRVSITTLDKLIESYGLPNFCKIDVEGFELEVITGLNYKIPIICFEFTKEFLNDAIKCINYLNSLGIAKFNFVFEKEMKFYLLKWRTHKEIVEILQNIEDKSLCGDIYVKLR